MSGNQPLDSSGNSKPKTKFIKTATIARGAERIGPQPEQSDRRTDKNIIGKNFKTYICKSCRWRSSCRRISFSGSTAYWKYFHHQKKNNVSKLNYKGKISRCSKKDGCSCPTISNDRSAYSCPNSRRNS